MPVITVEGPKIPDLTKKRELVQEFTKAASAAFGLDKKAIIVIQDLVAYYEAHPQEVPDSYTVADADSLTRAIDYVAGMTDRFALNTHDRLFRPTLLD